MPGFMMQVVNHVTGDIGGAGLSRYHISRADGTLPTAVDATAAGNAIHSFYAAFASFSPSGVSNAVDGAVQILDPDSAVVVGTVSMSPVPSAVNGLQTGAYGAGLGVRVNWHTTTILNRRRMRGASLVVPLFGNAFSTTGALQGSTTSTVLSAASTLLSSLATAGLQLVVWHRPARGASSGGVEAPVTSVQVGPTPAGLRSRRS